MGFGELFSICRTMVFCEVPLFGLTLSLQII